MSEHEDGGRPWVAIPFPDIDALWQTVGEVLEAAGLGRWQLEPAGEGELPADGVVIAVPNEPRLWTLRPLDAGARIGVGVQLVGRLVASWLAAEHRAEVARRAEERAREASLLDPDTGLLNSRGWAEVLDRERMRCDRTGVRAVIAIIDLDDLKTVNDEQGHLAGDVLLRQTADELRRCVRGSDVVARIGGDEFAVLAVDYQEPVPETLLYRLDARLEESGVSASVGAAVYDPGGDVLAVLRAADAAMYARKRVRKGGR